MYTFSSQVSSFARKINKVQKLWHAKLQDLCNTLKGLQNQNVQLAVTQSSSCIVAIIFRQTQTTSLSSWHA